MKRRTCLLLLLLPTLLQAQRNFQKAYIVTLQGDTINGWINYQEWGYTPAEILFKPDNGTSEIRHPADTIQHEPQPTPAVVQNDSYRLQKGNVSLLARAGVVFGNRLEASFIYLPPVALTSYSLYGIRSAALQLQVYDLLNRRNR